MKARDQQRSKVYAWEDKLPKGKDLDLKECGKLIKRVANHYKTLTPRVGDGRGRRVACYNPSSFVIKLPRWARHERTVLHEAAHQISIHLNYTRHIPWHGREFVGVYMHLLNKYMGIPLSDLTKSANEAGIDFMSAASCKPPRK